MDTVFFCFIRLLNIENTSCHKIISKSIFEYGKDEHLYLSHALTKCIKAIGEQEAEGEVGAIKAIYAP